MYTGITNNLERRMFEHKNKLVDGFTAKYNVNKLVYFDYTPDVTLLLRGKNKLKVGQDKKNDLIQSINPEWRDLSEEFL